MGRPIGAINTFEEVLKLPKVYATVAWNPPRIATYVDGIVTDVANGFKTPKGYYTNSDPLSIPFGARGNGYFFSNYWLAWAHLQQMLRTYPKGGWQ